MLNAEASSAARDAGAWLALEAEARKYELERAIIKAAQALPSLTSDEVWGILEEWGITALDHPNALGAAMLAAGRRGIIEASGRVQKSARVSAHRRNVQVWKSNIFRGANAQ